MLLGRAQLRRCLPIFARRGRRGTLALPIAWRTGLAVTLLIRVVLFGRALPSAATTAAAATFLTRGVSRALTRLALLDRGKRGLLRIRSRGALRRLLRPALALLLIAVTRLLAPGLGILARTAARFIAFG